MTAVAIAELTIGADPEVFITSNGKFIPATETSIEGTKRKPKVIYGSRGFPIGATQIDGVAVEFNINPARSRYEFSANVRQIMEYIQSKLSVDGFEIDTVTRSINIPLNIWESIPDFNKKLGCSPEFNCYSGRRIQTKPLADKPSFRTVGGHIWLGWDHGMNIPYEMVKELTPLVKNLDHCLYPLSLLYDYDRARMDMYGQPGNFRVAPAVGLEYRTLSNFWCFDQALARMVYDATVFAFRKWEQGIVLSDKSPLEYSNMSCEELKECLLSIGVPL